MVGSEPDARPGPIGPVARPSTLQALEMSGSYPLDDAAIDAVLTRRAPGNYALGFLDDGVFVVFYVGRSNRDVRRRLHQWVGRPSPHERYASPERAPWGVRRRAPLPVGVPALGRVSAGQSSYTRFAFSYASSADAAFLKECRNYDDFGGRAGLDNDARPAA